ncbi:MAG: hypothetical protein ABI873_16375 [Marmoricola sp.]
MLSRILAVTRARSAATVSLVANVPLGDGATAYARLGDWFSLLCLLLTGLTPLLDLRVGSRPLGSGVRRTQEERKADNDARRR